MDFKKILIAVDGSENAMRAVNYVGEIINGGQGFSVTLLCIERFPERDLFPDETAWRERCAVLAREMREFLDRARDALLTKGVDPGAVSRRYVESCRSPLAEETAPQCSPGVGIAREIVGVAEEGDFGAVVLGRRGVSKAEEFLFGSVSTKIIHSIKNRTVWVVA